MSKVSIIGAYNTKFGQFVELNTAREFIRDTKTIYELLVEAGKGAMDDAGVSPKDIDAIYVGSCSPSMFANQEHVAPLALLISDDFRFKHTTRTEGACASSSVALYNAVMAIESGRFNNILVIGVEKMNRLATPAMTHTLACSSFFPEEGRKGVSFPMLFAMYGKGYKEQYKLSDADFEKMLAAVGAHCYKNGAKNPIAQVQNGPDTIDKILAMNKPDDKGKIKNAMVAPPLRLHDCSLVSDGAAALVITKTENAKNKKKAVEIAGFGISTEFMPMSKKPNHYKAEGAIDAFQKACKEAGVTINDIQVAEVHDCFTINQIVLTEALGLAKDGKGGFDYIDGKFGANDKCGVNLSGGLKSKGHPVGATGASMHVHVYRQLIGEPLGEKKEAEMGAIVNVGGSNVTNCASVLRRIK